LQTRSRAEPFSDPELRSLLALGSERERAVSLLLLDTGLWLSELASLRVGDVRPDGTLHVIGKRAKERIVPMGATARRALNLGRGGASPRIEDNEIWSHPKGGIIVQGARTGDLRTNLLRGMLVAGLMPYVYEAHEVSAHRAIADLDFAIAHPDQLTQQALPIFRMWRKRIGHQGCRLDSNRTSTAPRSIEDSRHQVRVVDQR
jgi:hypothetical protein